MILGRKLKNDKSLLNGLTVMMTELGLIIQVPRLQVFSLLLFNVFLYLFIRHVFCI